MAAETITPTCEVTGLPLSIGPERSREIEAFSVSGAYDRHHAFHPERSDQLKTIAGLALRNSRIQSVRYDLHHHGYHNIFVGSELPENPDDYFRLSILAVAGVVPRSAIKIINKDEYEVVGLTNAQHAGVAERVMPDSTKEISRFYTQYAVEKGFDWLLGESTIDALLDRRTPYKQRREIASNLVREILGETIKELNLDKAHREYKQEGLIAAQRPHTFAWTAKRLVRIHHLDYFRELVGRQAGYLQTGVA